VREIIPEVQAVKEGLDLPAVNPEEREVNLHLLQEVIEHIHLHHHIHHLQHIQLPAAVLLQEDQVIVAPDRVTAAPDPVEESALVAAVKEEDNN
jgi:hypothetical protein